MRASNVQTQAVAGAAYGRRLDTTLTHAVDLETGRPLCGRVRPENLLDDVEATDPHAAPSCPVCAKRDPRRAL